MRCLRDEDWACLMERVHEDQAYVLSGVTDGSGHLLTFEMTNVKERRVTDDSGLTAKGVELCL